MAKKFSKVSKTAIAAALAASSVVPAASAFAAESISSVVVTQNGVKYEITKAQFDAALGLGKTFSIDSLKVAGKYYAKNDFNALIGTGKTPAQAIDALPTTAAITPQNITPTTTTLDASGNITATTAVAVSSVSAINGTVTVVLDKEVTSVTAADFTFTQAINGTTATPVTASAATLGVDKKTVTLTVPQVAQTAAAQNVVVSAAYKGGVAKTATAYTVAATAVAVSTVSALTNTTVDVTFNTAPTTTPVASDFTFDNGLTVSGVVLKSGTTYTVTTSVQDSTKTYAVSYKGTATGKTFKGLASTDPVVNTVTTTVNTTNTVTISGKAVNAEKVRITVDAGTPVDVALNADGTFTYITPAPLAGGDHSISVVAVKGSTVTTPTTNTVSIATNGVTTVEVVDNQTLKVTFGAALADATAIEAAKNRFVLVEQGKALSSGERSTVSSISSDKKTVTVKFATGLTSGKTYKLALVDSAATLYTATELASKTGITFDVLAKPVVAFDTTDVDRKKFTLTFPKTMYNNGGTTDTLTAASYTLLDDAGQVVGGSSGAFLNAAGTFKANTSDKVAEFVLATGKLQAGKTYKLVLGTNVKAKDGSTYNQDDAIVTFTTPSIADVTPKIAFSQVTANNTIKLTFDRAVNNIAANGGIINSITSGVVKEKVSSTPETIDDANTSITSNVLTIQTTGTNLAANKTYVIDISAGLARNSYYTNVQTSAYPNYEVVAVADTAPAFTGAEFIKDTTSNTPKADLLLKFDKPVQAISAAGSNQDKVKILIPGKTYGLTATTTSNLNALSVYDGDATGKTLIIKDVEAAFTSSTGGYNSLTTDDLEEKSYTVDIAGSFITVNTVGGSAQAVTAQQIATGIDLKAPSVKSVTLDSSDKMTIKFSEAIDSTALNTNKITVAGFVKGSNGAFAAGTLNASQLNYSLNGDTLVLTTANADNFKFQTGVVGNNSDTLVAFEANSLVDSKGNKAGLTTVAENASFITDNAQPVMIAASTATATTLAVTFTEDISQEGNLAGGNHGTQFAVANVESGKDGVGTNANVSVNNNAATVTFTSSSFVVSKAYPTGTVTYTRETDKRFKDAKGNLVENTIITNITSGF